MIWATDHIRLFISHRDADKVGARRIADALAGFGFSSFVAHEAILAGNEWRRDLREALETMEVMLVLVGDQESSWVDQEIGFALARNVPIVPVCYETRMPRGFLDNTQALKMDISHALLDVSVLVQVMTEGLDGRVRVKDALIAALLKSTSYNDAIERFDRLTSAVDSLSEEQAKVLIRGFLANDQLYGSGYLAGPADRFLKFLNRTATKQYRYENRTIVAV